MYNAVKAVQRLKERPRHRWTETETEAGAETNLAVLIAVHCREEVQGA